MTIRSLILTALTQLFYFYFRFQRTFFLLFIYRRRSRLSQAKGGMRINLWGDFRSVLQFGMKSRDAHFQPVLQERSRINMWVACYLFTFPLWVDITASSLSPPRLFFVGKSGPWPYLHILFDVFCSKHGRKPPNGSSPKFQNSPYLQKKQPRYVFSKFLMELMCLLGPVRKVHEKRWHQP